MHLVSQKYPRWLIDYSQRTRWESDQMLLSLYKNRLIFILWDSTGTWKLSVNYASALFEALSTLWFDNPGA